MAAHDFGSRLVGETLCAHEQQCLTLDWRQFGERGPYLLQLDPMLLGWQHDQLARMDPVCVLNLTLASAVLGVEVVAHDGAQTG